MASKVVLYMTVQNPGGAIRTGAFPSSFSGGGPAHLSGFSESIWYNTNDLDYIKANVNGVAAGRAPLLPTSASVAFARIYLGGGGRGILLALGRPGASGTSDQVQCALLCQGNSATAPNPRRFWIHCVPDEQITNGEFHPTFVYASALNTYLNGLSNNTYFYSKGLSPIATIFNVTTGGLVTTVLPHTFTAGQILTVLRTLNAAGQRVGGKFLVTSTGPLSTQLTLSAWTAGATTGGQIGSRTNNLYPIGPIQVTRSGTRKVGRPFGQYVGRQRRRRRPV